jgi:DNA-binding PadR family transcriptional regulator
MRKERVTQPTLDVYEALLGAEGFELHGWAIIKTTKRSGPTVYKILERLLADERVTARWEVQAEDAKGPRRRFYKLTPDGTAYARSLLAERRPQTAQRFGIAFGCGGTA